MTKPATKTATTAASEFKFDTGLAIPPAARGARTSAIARKLQAMPVGASFLEAVTVPDTIKDDAERDKVFKETARTLSNRLSGTIRRFKKSNPDANDFELRTVNDDTLGRGVRVWCKDKTAA